jgi:NAD(P)-dependent dehydrogenase (short-subunit alcohol dehydrogenase family)
VKGLFKEMDNEIGPIDILVNNAGCESVVHVLDMEEADWDKVMNVNLKGPFLCSQQAAQRMENKGGGVIINISSIHDVVPRKGLIHYCSAKAGLKMFSKCLSLELADKNIRVVSIAPGAIETNMNREEIAKFGKEKFENWIPQGRIGNVKDVANTVVFMASDLADYINGADIYIDGAYMNHTIQYDPRPERKIK